jgi:predicted transcriptional regulator
VKEDLDEVVETVFRRAPVLARLVDGAADKPTLVADLDVSRSTVDRALRELLTNDLVERTDAGYRTTLAGRLALGAFERFCSRVRGVDDALDVLAVLPRDAPFPAALFDGARVERPTPVAPHRPAERNEQLLSWADHVRGCISAVSEQYVANYRRAIDDGTSVELVFPTAVFERLVREYELADDPVLEAEGVAVRQTDESLPCSVKLHTRDDEAVASLTVYGPDGLRGLVTNDSPEAVAWVRSYLDERWAAADPLPSR